MCHGDETIDFCSFQSQHFFEIILSLLSIVIMSFAVQNYVSKHWICFKCFDWGVLSTVLSKTTSVQLFSEMI